MNYFIIVNDAQQGPYTIDELRQRHITEETLVWCEGMTDWQPVWQVDDLKPLFAGGTASGQPTPPPVPHTTSQAGNTDATATTGAPNGSDAIDNPALNGRNGSGAAGKPANDAANRPKSKKKLYIVLGVVALALFILALTNPSPAEHRRAIDDKIGDASFDIDDNHTTPLASSIMSIFSSFGKGVAIQMLKDVVDSDLTYHNYIFFSTTTVHVAMLHEDVHTSTGFLGHVNAIDLTSILPEIITKQMTGGLFDSDGKDADHSAAGAPNDEETDGSGTENDGSASESATTEQPAANAPSGEQVSTITRVVKQNGMTIDSATKHTAMRVANEIAGKVKKDIQQQSDKESSDEANGIIDEVLGFLKSILSSL